VKIRISQDVLPVLFQVLPISPTLQVQTTKLQPSNFKLAHFFQAISMT
jgi:hypothetical protein